METIFPCRAAVRAIARTTTTVIVMGLFAAANAQCPLPPSTPTLTVGSYAVCRGGVEPSGQGLLAVNVPASNTVTYSFPGSGFWSEGTGWSLRSTLTVPAIPAGTVVLSAKLKLYGAYANTSGWAWLIGSAGREAMRVALNGSYNLGETALTAQTGPGAVTPDPVIDLPGFPTSGGTINLFTRQTWDHLLYVPDGAIGTADIEVTYGYTTTVYWYAAATGGSALQSGNLFQPVTSGIVNNNVVGSTTFYAACRYGACEGGRVPAVFTVNAPANAGTSATTSACSNGAPFALFSKLGGTPNAGGSWTFGGVAASPTFTPGTSPPGTYTYTVAGTSPCPNASATVTVNVSTAPNAGTSGTTTVCSSAAPFALISKLGGTPNGGGAWTYGGSPVSGTFTPGVSSAGVYTYTVTGTAPCANAVSTVTVNVVQAPNAGISATTSVCSNGAAFALITKLGGTPNTGGTWTFGGVAMSGTFTPGVNAAGVYTYTVTGTAPCTNASATVTVSVVAAPNAGTSGTTTVCSNAAAFTLISKLGGAPSGSGAWTFAGSPVSGTFTPGVSAAGVYTYTVTGTSPCANATSTVTVNVVQAANAGTSASTTVCSNAAPFALTSKLGGTPNSGGTWTFAGSPVSGTFTPGTSSAGVYTYTVTSSAPCSPLSATATVTVSVTAAPNAGTSSSIAVCSNGAPFTLLSKLGGSPSGSGTWTFAGSPVSGTFTPGVSAAGVYTYTVTGTAPCTNATSTVTITVNTPPNAGTSASTTVCSNGAPFTLISKLGGTPNVGGTWTLAGAPVSATFTPGSSAAGVYTYTVTGTAPCANASSTVTVTVVAAPNAGTSNAITVCSTDAPFALVSRLGGTPSGSGSWTFAGSPVSGTFTPGASAPGIYTYTVTGTAPCTNATSTVTVTVTAAVVWYADTDGDGAGDPTSTLSSCTQPPGYVANNNDQCPIDPNKVVPGQCGCGVADTDTDHDGTADCTDGCPNDPNKIAAGICGCGVADTDTDHDGTADCNDACPNDPNKIAAGICGCGVADTDTDHDGTADCHDGCPNDPNKIAVGICGCGVADTDTDHDGTADCHDGCPNDPNKIAGGQCGCGVPDTDTDADGTADCHDGCPDDPSKLSPGICGCSTPDVDTDSDGLADCIDPCPSISNNTDSDNDGYADCVDDCPNDPNKIAPGACGCGAADTDTDGDGHMDCADGCPNDPNKIGPGTCGCGNPEPGMACDDGDVNTINDAIDANCTCTGTSNGPNVALVLTTDNDAASTSWEIAPVGSGPAVCTGTGYANNSTYTLDCDLPDGCYTLRVFDANGDGMCCTNGNGGYVLRLRDGRRIIDATGSGIFNATAEVALGFCLPLGDDRVSTNRCDREDYLPSDFIEAARNPAVQAQWGIGTQSDDGYQFWFFNPNGGYSRKVLLTHASNNYQFPPGPDRCSYIGLNSFTSNPLPFNTLLNVRVRSMVNGVYSAYGSACRLKIDLTGKCPTTRLDPNAGDHLSCGATDVPLDGSRYLWAVPVSGATNYQFEFSTGSYLRKIATTSSGLLMTRWATSPLQNGQSYAVRVRVSFNNGASYCSFGETCTVSIASATRAFHGMEAAPEAEHVMFRIWPNPNSDGRLRIDLSAFGDEAGMVPIDVLDAFGKQVKHTQVILGEGSTTALIDLPEQVPSGLYLVQVTIGERIHTERLILAR